MSLRQHIQAKPSKYAVLNYKHKHLSHNVTFFNIVLCFKQMHVVSTLNAFYSFK